MSCSILLYFLAKRSKNFPCHIFMDLFYIHLYFDSILTDFKLWNWCNIYFPIISKPELGFCNRRDMSVAKYCLSCYMHYNCKDMLFIDMYDCLKIGSTCVFKMPFLIKCAHAVFHTNYYDCKMVKIFNKMLLSFENCLYNHCKNYVASLKKYYWFFICHAFTI